MRRRLGATARGLPVLLALLGLAVGAAAEPDESTCVSCHEQEEAGAAERIAIGGADELRIEAEVSLPVREWRASVHAAHEVSCDACHGGDPREEDEDLSMSEEAGFLELPAWTEIAEHCGVCHEELAARWQAGVFGARMQEGERVATCATCHMQNGHRIEPAQPAELLGSSRCPDCPSPDDGPELVALLEQVDRQEQTALARVGSVQQKGIVLADLRAEVHATRRAHALALHGFDGEEIRRASAAALDRYAELHSLAADWEAEADARRRYGAVVVAVLAVLFVALLRLQRWTPPR